MHILKRIYDKLFVNYKRIKMEVESDIVPTIININNNASAKTTSILKSLFGTTSFIIFLVIIGYIKLHMANNSAASKSIKNSFLYGL